MGEKDNAITGGINMVHDIALQRMDDLCKGISIGYGISRML